MNGNADNPDNPGISPEQSSIPNDPLGAFCRANHVALEPTGSGLLDGLGFAAKDVFDIAGSVTGFGQPTWLQTHEPATANARVVDQLLAAGARLAGKTISDELTYSLTGENVHYGTPLNPNYPDRVPGGSSSGSVSAVAGGLVDFSLGTDCAGSVRLPASYCGVFGMRPTHDHVSTEGVLPFAPSIDTVGWFARDADTLHRVGSVLLNGHAQTSAPQRLLIANDCFELIAPEIREALQGAVQQVREHFPVVEEVTVSSNGLESWMECFRIVQGAEIWNSLGPWITEAKPTLGPGIDERVAGAKAVTEAQLRDAKDTRKKIVARMGELLQPGDMLCIPCSPRVAPQRNTATSTVEVTYRYQAICLLSIAGLAGLPQISMPLAMSDGLPLGLSLVGSAGADMQLMELAMKMQLR